MEKEILDKLRPGMRVRVLQKTPSRISIQGKKFKGVKSLKEEKENKEKEKEKIQSFEGIILARKHGKETGATITVRSVVAGIGVEKIYPLYSPLIRKIEILQEASKYRRAKLYYLRKVSARRIREKIGTNS